MSEERDERTDIDWFLREVARTPELTTNLALTQSALVGRRIRQYRITRLIGRGGMGQVFAADDHLLGREVAIKLLPPAFTAELRRRFLQEARSLARIQHPAVATFYEAGEERGLAFLAMEYVAGETLRDVLERGPIEMGQTLGLVMPLLEGLAHIHHAGLLHRDIKPENIIVTPDGAAKLLDLGVATAMHASVGPGDPAVAAQTITQVGSVVGSLAYMAPEQLLGEQLDARTDLFSLGVVLFECLTGHHPFRGTDGADTRRRILAGEVAAMESGLLDDEVAAVLARMLAIDREARYPSVAPLLREIQTLAVAGGARLPDSIAVLPFADRDGGDWSGAALADGLRRELERVEGVQVVPREQIAALCAAHDSVPIAVGFAAGCRWVISGRIHRQSGRWEVSAELLNVATDSVAARSEAIVDDLAAAARGLGDRIVESIGLLGDPLHGPLAPSDIVARAMELAWRKVGRRDFREAIGLLEEVLRLEPDNIEALVQFGQIAGLLHSSTRDPELSAAARTRLERAVELDPDNPRANQWLGYNLSAHGELIDAEQHFATARMADSGNWQHYYFHAGSLMALPLHAIPEIAARRGVRDLLDPVSWRRSAALDELRKAATLAPRNAFAFWGLGAIQYEIGAYDESIVAFERAVELEAVSPLATGGIAAFLAEALRRAGRRDQAREAALAALETTERNDHMYRDLFRSVALCAVGRTHLDLGDRDAARASFEQARLLLEARPEVRSGGNVLVQALSGLGCTGQRRSLDRAKRLFEDRDTHSFDWVHMCGDDFALAQIARACVVVGDPEARVYIARAREAGSLEASELEVG